MQRINPLKLTLVIIPIAIVLTLLLRYVISIFLESALHPAFTLVIYIAMFSALKLAGEKLLVEKAVNRGKYSWFLSE